MPRLPTNASLPRYLSADLQLFDPCVLYTFWGLQLIWMSLHFLIMTFTILVGAPALLYVSISSI
jgi:hypothetical protein